MFIKEKRYGTIKARGYANRKSQQEYTNKADTSSPTKSLEAMLLSVRQMQKKGNMSQ